MACFRVMTTEVDGKVVQSKYVELPANTVEEALKFPEISKWKSQAKKDGLCFRVTKEG